MHALHPSVYQSWYFKSQHKLNYENRTNVCLKLLEWYLHCTLIIWIKIPLETLNTRKKKKKKKKKKSIRMKVIGTKLYLSIYNWKPPYILMKSILNFFFGTLSFLFILVSRNNRSPLFQRTLLALWIHNRVRPASKMFGWIVHWVEWWKG